jgi:hypothetical protein
VTGPADPAYDPERTRQLALPRPAPAPAAALDDDGYSATALDGSWTDAAPAAPPARPVLRYGPGVPPGSATAVLDLAALDLADARDSGPPPAARGRFGWLRRYGLAVTVLAVVAAFVLWQRTGPPLAVTGVTASAEAPPACDAEAEVTAVVRTNGRPGTIRYQWHRSDGTASGPLEERLGRGQREARLTLLWTFHGRGTVEATAELRVSAPDTHTTSAAFTYHCS